MPTYEYVCDACGHSFDELQSFSDAPLTKCPKCGKKRLRRLFGTGAAVLFKGSGFYQTDYRSESYKAAAKAEQEKTSTSKDGAASANGTSDNAAKKSDAKPAKAGGKSSKSAAKSSDD